MSVFIKGLFACSVGPLKLSLRISSFGYHLLSWRSITGPNFKPGGLTNPEISRARGICPHSVPTCGHTCRILDTLSPIPTKSFPRPKFAWPTFARRTYLLVFPHKISAHLKESWEIFYITRKINYNVGKFDFFRGKPLKCVKIQENLKFGST